MHTADWHLGRILHGLHLTEEQQHRLRELGDVVERERPDALLIAGDVYDRAVPPPDAVRVLDDFLSRVVLDLRVPVVMVAGNHDSAERLGFGSGMLARSGLHVVGRLSHKAPPLRLADEHGPVDVFGLPYADMPYLRQQFADHDFADRSEAVTAVASRLLESAREDSRRVLVAHEFVTGGDVSDSERPLSVGGAGTIGTRCFKGFDYVALGHLHRRQALGGDRIRYAGSLFKYSFSEAAHEKSVDLVTLGESGEEPIVEHISLHPQHDLRRMDGTLDELLEMTPTEDFLSVTLRDTSVVFDAMGKLRKRHPNVLHIERPVSEAGSDGQQTLVDRRSLSDVELFAAFFLDMEKRPIEEAERQALVSILEAVERERREVSA